MKSSSDPWFGVWPVMMTAFNADRTIDWNGVDALTDWYIDSGVAGLFACCGSSEVFHLSEREKLDLADRIVTRAAGRVPVVAGAIGQADGSARREATLRLHALGVAAVVLAPSEFAPESTGEDDVVTAMLAFAEAVPGVPLGLYECPMPYWRRFTPEAVGVLARSGRFVWMKDTSCDADVLQRKAAIARGTPLKLYNANTPLMVEAIRRGCDGYSGLAANFCPRLVSQVCTEPDPAAREPRFELIAEAEDRIINRGYPLAAKLCARELGVRIEPVCRVKVAELSADQRQLIHQFASRFRTATDTDLALAAN